MKLKKEVIVQKDPKSPVSEVFRTLRTNIQFMNTSKKLKTLLITSTLPGEGKSWVTSNLAVTFAQAGKKVVLIDADMRKGRQYTIFGASPRPGLSNYLSETDPDDPSNTDISDYIQKTEVENLLLITAGNVPPNPSELLVSPQMNNLLEELKEVCDIIIVDGTPCELVTDSIILSRIVDSTIIVASYKQTRKDSLERIIKSIQNVGGKLAGVVINKMPVSIKKYNQKYYYESTSYNGTSKKVSSNELKRKTTTTIKQNKEHENIYKRVTKNDEDVVEDSEELERPDFFKKQNSNPNKSLNDTKQILKKINTYLDEEKKNLN